MIGIYIYIIIIYYIYIIIVVVVFIIIVVVVIIIYYYYNIYVDTGIYEPTNKQTQNTLKESNSGSPALAKDGLRPRYRSVFFPRNPWFFPSKCVPHYLSTTETSSR